MFVHRIVTLLAALRPAIVQAHCDTAEGPAVTDGRRALETGNVNHALKWIPADGEAELRDVFDKALRVRGLGPDAAEVADRLFLETLVRVHRMGEGVGFTGIQPTGTQVDPVVAAADEAIAAGLGRGPAAAGARRSAAPSSTSGSRRRWPSRTSTWTTSPLAGATSPRTSASSSTPRARTTSTTRRGRPRLEPSTTATRTRTPV